MIGITLKEQALVLLLPVWIIITIIRCISYKKQDMKVINKKEITINLFFIYFLCLASVKFFPLNINFKNENHISPVVNIIPTIDTINGLIRISKSSIKMFRLIIWVRNIIGNGLLLLPLSIFLPLLWEKFRNIKLTVLVCFLFSVLIECLQYISVYWGNTWIFDIDDIILNTLGAVIGYIIYDKVLRKIKLFGHFVPISN